MVQKPASIWGEHNIPTRVTKFMFGSTRLWIKKRDDELWLAAEHLDGAYSKTTTNSSKDLNWARWILGNKQPKIGFSPLFPDRPVIVKPEFSFKLLHKETAKIYVQVPLWVRVVLVGKKTVQIMQVPTTVLSNTWFGTHDEGELCYWLTSLAQRKTDTDHKAAFSVRCPIQIINRAEEELTVEKLALRVERLTLFEFGGKLWSDLTKVSYGGANEISRIQVSGKAPDEAPAAKTIAPARNAGKKGFSAKTFDNFIELAGLDWIR